VETPKLGRYLVESELGRGAMGIVYKARDPMLERTVAIKTINMALEREGIKEYEARFRQEARAAGGLNHPAIVTIYDIGRSGDVAYMAMEFIQGVELRALLAGGKPLPLERAVSIAAQVAEGLAYAHERGVVHRDVKPANIMVAPDGSVKITDFGIARLRASGDLTQTGTMLGSPRYMSPEQVLGKRADHRSDVFSLGIIFYEMLTGAPPFAGDNVTALMYQIVNFVPPAPSAVNRQLPELIDFVIAKALAKPLEERYQGAREFAADLRAAERQLGAAAASRAVPRLPAAALAPGAQPALVSTDARTVVLAQTLDRTRRADEAPADAAAPAAHGLSRSFDSAEATQRLAALTGADASALATASAPLTATQMMRTVEKEARPRGWRRRDWLLVGGAAALGLWVARGIVRKRSPG
jgi:serine/threonine-protein kinase